MNFDFKRAFYTPFKFKNESEWVFIYLIAALLSLLGYFNFSFNMNFDNPHMNKFFSEFIQTPLFGLLLFCVTVLMIIQFFARVLVFGYVLKTIKLELENEEFIMPLWRNNWKEFFWYGFKLNIAVLIYLTILCSIPFLFFIAAFLSQSVPLSAYLNFTHPDKLVELLMALVLNPLTIAGIAIFLFIFLFYTIIFPSIVVVYAERKTFTSAFDLISALKFISSNLLEYIILLFIGIGGLLLSGIATLILCCTCVGIIFAPVITSFIFPIIFYNMIAQVYKHGLLIKQNLHQIE